MIGAGSNITFNDSSANGSPALLILGGNDLHFNNFTANAPKTFEDWKKQTAADAGSAEKIKADMEAGEAITGRNSLRALRRRRIATRIW